MNSPATMTIDPAHPATPLMSLEEARRMCWLRTYPRPLGELYDEGYLNRSRLEWAAAKAYDPRLRQACQLLLRLLKPGKPAEKTAKMFPFELPDSALSIGITLEQARSTPWPLPPYTGQLMGALVEARQLSLKDLVYAVENAWEQRVRRAATALLLVRLNQTVKEPAPPAGLMKVVSGGRSYAERKQLQLSMVQGLIMGGIFGAVLIGFITYFLLHRPAQAATSFWQAIKTPIGMIALVIIVALLGLEFLGMYAFDRFVLKKMDRSIDAYRQGQEGEQDVVEVILQTLDGNWTLFRNLQLPGRNRADLDTVLVGPSGVWVLEIKNYTGEYRNIGDEWEYRSGERWTLLRKSPSRQAQKNAARLGEFLKADGIKQWVNAAVVWANRERVPGTENPAVPVWTLDRLPDELGNLWQDEKVPADVRARIVEKLEKLCQRQEERTARVA
jgi:hypothetical protein